MEGPATKSKFSSIYDTKFLMAGYQSIEFEVDPQSEQQLRKI